MAWLATKSILWRSQVQNYILSHKLQRLPRVIIDMRHILFILGSPQTDKDGPGKEHKLCAT